MTRLPTLSARKLIQVLEKAGFVLDPISKIPHPALLAVAPIPHGAPRELCFTHCDRGATQRGGATAATPWGYWPLFAHSASLLLGVRQARLRRRSLIVRTVAHIAGGLFLRWGLDRQRGSHYVMVHRAKHLTTCVPMRGKDIKRSLVHLIFKQAGLTEEEFQKLL